MATLHPYKNKNGKIVSYQIRVYRGTDSNGTQLKPYTMSWKVPETYRSEKAIQKALEKVAGEFEAECKRGTVSADKSTVNDYINYYIPLKARNSKTKSTDFYTGLKERIIENLGFIKLNKLSAEHLNNFYIKLEDEDVRKDKKAIAKKALLSLKAERRLTHSKLSELCELSHNTIRIALQEKKISIESAEKISKALGKNIEQLFNFVTPDNKKGLSSKTINHYHTFIHAMLEQAVKEGRVAGNVADKASPPKVKKKEAQFFEIDEIFKIRDALLLQPSKYRIGVYLLIDTGIRRGELFGIRWKSIDLTNRTITIENNIQWSKDRGLYAETPKSDDVRTVSIAPEIVTLLKEYKKEQNAFKLMLGAPDYNKDGYLFIQDNGTVMHPSSINSWMKKFEQKHNLPHIHPHKFRHSQASILYANGVDPVTISKRLGHAQVSTTQNIYAHIMKESDQKASDTIANVLYRNQA